jgi:hypothetical protein
MNQIDIINSHLPADLLPGIRRFHLKTMEDGELAAEGVEFTSGKIVMAWKSGAITVYDSLKAAANVHYGINSLEIEWIGDADYEMQRDLLEQAHQNGLNEGAQHGEKDIGLLERTLNSIVTFAAEVIGEEPPVGQSDSQYVNGIIEALDQRVMDGKRLSGALLAQVKIARHVISTLVASIDNPVSAAVFHEAQRQGRQFLQQTEAL